MNRTITSAIAKTLSAFVIGLLALPTFVWLANAEPTASARSGKHAATRQYQDFAQLPVTVQAEGRGTSRIKFKDGRDVPVAFNGDSNLAQAVPLALAAGDFNSDGYEDIIGGFSSAGGGVVTLYLTNRDAIAPSTAAIHQEMMNGRFPAPILPEAASFVIPENPDLIGTGDFNRDGYKDVLTAARGSFALHLLAGDGRGNFKYEKRVKLPGTVTTLLADDVNNYDGMTDAIVGIGGGFAPKALVFHNTDAMFDQQPAEINLPADAVSMAVGQLDADALKDLVVAVGGELLVVRGYNNLANENLKMKIERVALPSTACSVTTGEFLFDREMRPEIAVLLDDGSVTFASRGNIDRRPYSIEEQRIIAEKRRARDKEGLTNFTKTRLRREGSETWKIEENAVASKGSVGAEARLVTAPLAGLSTDDLMVVDAENNQMRIIQSSQSGTDSQTSVMDLEMPSGAVAAVSLRLNIDTASDIALLRQGSSAPTLLLSPDATINVTSTADVIANNGLCTLREAIINSNTDSTAGSTDCTAGSGADTIMIPAGTYTLTIGPFDDDQLIAGYLPTSGDLDIADDDGPGADVGNVTLMGVANSTFIQAGTTTTNGIDRVFDVNNFGGPGYAVNATFTNLTIRHGRGVVTPGGYFTPGGGIQFDGFDVPVGGASNKLLTLNNSTVTLNNAAAQGGGILAIFCAASLVNSTVSSNSVTDTGGVSNWNNGAGGGMSYDGGAATTPARTFSMSGTTFSGNVISSSDGGQGNFGQGGGARLAGGTGASITGSSQILSNDAKSLGGGFSIDTIPAVTISDTLVNGNVADTDGGGIFSKPVNSDGTLSSLTLTNVQFINNQADDDDDNTGDGGGLYHDRGTLSITDGTIGTPVGANTAFNGGGLAHDFESLPSAGIVNGSSITINGTNISNNTARGSGGGIYHDSLNVSGGQNSTLTLGSTTNVDLLNNTANLNGGGLSNTNAGIANLTRATIRGNRADTDGNNTGDGGGVFNNTNGAVTITGATTPIGGVGLGNTARNGGGIANLGGTLSMTNGSIVANGTAANPATANGGGLYVNGGTVTLTGVAITDNIATTGNGFNLNGGTLNLAGTLNITNNVALTGGTFNGQTSTVNLTGNFAYTAGTFNAGTSTFNFNGTGLQSISNSSLITFNNLTDSNVSQPLTVNNSINVNGTLNINGANAVFAPVSGAIIGGGTGTLTGTGTVRVTRISGSNDFFGQYAMPNRTLTNLTVDYVGTSAQGVSGTTYSNVSLNNASGGTLSGSATVNGTLSLIAGVLNVGANSLTINNGTSAGAGSLASGATGTVNYNQGSAGQNVLVGSYGNLTFSNFNKTLPAATVGVAGTFTPGTATGHTTTGSTFNFNGAGAQTVPVFSYDNLTISGARGGATVTLGNGTINVAGVFSPTATAVNYVVTGNTFVFNGAAQTIPAFTFNNLTTGGSGTKTLGGNVTTQGALTIGSGTTLNGSSFNLNAAGGWTNNGAFAPATGTVVFNGTSAQTVGGTSATDFNNLTINNAAGVTFNFNSTVGNLTLTSGNVLMGANILTLNGAVSRTSGHVIGSLKKTLNPGNNFTYTVGTANGYSPVNMLINSGTGDLTVSATQAVLTPPLNNATGLRRYWTLTGTGTLNANLTFNYLDIDLAPGTSGTEGNYRLIRVVGGSGAAIIGARPNTVANTITASNVTQFSDWTMVWVNPTAATATIEGRVTTLTGRGISGARLGIESPSGEVRYVTTNPFGYYRFTDVAVGSSYVITVSHKRNTFGKSSRLITVTSDVQGVDFVSEQ